MKSLDERRALVTGAGTKSGIGWAACLKLAADGAEVIATDIADFEAKADGICARRLDVTDEAAITDLVEELEQRGGIDILVNNAGTTIGAAPFLDIQPEHWDISYRVNLFGPAILCQAVIPGMIARGAGSIINISSTGGLGAEAGFGGYTAMKHGVIGLTKTIAAEFGDRGIRCNAVCPGFISTAMHEGANERLATEQGRLVDEVRTERYQSVAMRRAGTVEEVADLIAFLAGPTSSYLTGAAVPVSGGTPVGL